MTWTDDQYEVAKMLKSKGKSYSQIAGILGKESPQAVSNYMRSRKEFDRIATHAPPKEQKDYDVPLTSKRADEILAMRNVRLRFEDM